MPQNSGMGGWNILFSVSKMKTASRLFCNVSHLGVAWESQKHGAEDYILTDSSVKPEQMRTGVRSTSHGTLAERKGELVPVLIPSLTGPAQIYCLQGSEARALPSP